MTALVRRPVLLGLFLFLPICENSFAQTLPSASSAVSAMNLANGYFQAQFPNPGLPVTTSGTVRPSNYWFRAVYFEGLMDFYQINPQPGFINYAVTWGTGNSWSLAAGNSDRNANDQCAGQSYIDLYNLNPTPAYIANIKADLDNIIASSAPVTDWWWIDAVHMAMPAWAKMGVLTGDSSYFNEMYELYANTRNTQGTAGLYNPVDSLWWRDATFVNPPFVEANGKSCYWSRGNGWVYSALARVLDILPPTDPHYAQYVSDFQAMSAAILAVQQTNGFWTQSLFDPVDFPGPETSGTALFAYGMAWGVRKGFLPAATYEPAAALAWNAMVADALHTNGFLGYVQDTGDQPVTGVTYTSVPAFQDIGVGCFLLAGSEIVKLADFMTASPTATHTSVNSPTASATSTPTTSATASPTSTATKTATHTPVNSPTLSATQTPTNSPTPTATPSATYSFTLTETASLTATPTSVNSPTLTATQTPTPSATSTATLTPTSTATLSFTSTGTSSPTATHTFVNSPSATPTASSTPSATSSPTATVSSTLTPTFTPTSSPTPSLTAGARASSTYSPSPIRSGTPTVTSIYTGTPSSTFTLSATETASFTVTPTLTFTPSLTPSATTTSTASSTLTVTASSTDSRTPTAFATETVTPAKTFSPSVTPTSSATPTATSASTSTPTSPLLTPSITHTSTPSATPIATTPVLFPNPATGSTVQLNLGFIPSMNVALKIYTTAFRLVLTKVYPVGSGEVISVALVNHQGTALANGLYYLVVSAGKNQWILKLMVTR
jgi:unsaturated rhamnogalacturonyl hydrolase